MMRGRWIWDDRLQKLVDADQYYQPSSKRSHLGTPYISSDTMAPVQSQLDGKMYDSKSALRATYKATPGIVEVGNDPARHRPFKRPPADTKAIKDSIQKAAARVERGERSGIKRTLK